MITTVNWFFGWISGYRRSSLIATTKNRQTGGRSWGAPSPFIGEQIICSLLEAVKDTIEESWLDMDGFQEHQVINDISLPPRDK